VPLGEDALAKKRFCGKAVNLRFPTMLFTYRWLTKLIGWREPPSVKGNAQARKKSAAQYRGKRKKI
jgi:hypothetical protein